MLFEESLEKEKERLVKDVFEYTLRYNVYDDIMERYNYDEKNLYNEIFNEIKENNFSKIEEQLKIDLSCHDYKDKEFVDIISLLYRVELLKKELGCKNE